MRLRIYFLISVLCLVFASETSFAQKPKTTSQTSQTRTITIVTEPKAIVWINDVRFGTTDESGKLTFNMVSGGAKKVRIRADGFKEVSQNLLPAQTEVKVSLAKTTDEAELAFQQAATLAALVDREKAVEMYKKAIALRPKYAEAYLEMARVLAKFADYGRK